MNKIRKSFRALSMIIRKPYLLNLVLDENDNWLQYVRKNYPGIVTLPELTLTDLFGPLDETISPFSFLDGGSLPTDIALLKGLAKQVENCSYFEIGTWRGESVANISNVARECYTMDLPDVDKRLMGMTEVYISQHAVLSRHLSNVTHLKANSYNFDFASLGKKFDLVFIDGDHHHKGVLNDTQKSYQHLVHENSMIVWHDYAYNPEKVRYEVFAGILDGLPPTEHHKVFHISNTMCAVYFPNTIESSGIRPTNFAVNLKSV